MPEATNDSEVVLLV